MIEKFLRTLYSCSRDSPNIVFKLDTTSISKANNFLLTGLQAARLQFCPVTPSRLLHSGTRGRKMNNFIANTFAEILGIIHLAAFSCLGIAVWIYFENRKIGCGVFSEIEPAFKVYLPNVRSISGTGLAWYSNWGGGCTVVGECYRVWLRGGRLR